MNEHPQLPEDAAEPLETLLRDGLDHLPDGGFTARVMGHLSPRRQRPNLRMWILAAGLAAGVVVLVCQAPAVEVILTPIREHSFPGLPGLLKLAAVLAAISSLLWAWISFGCEEA
jgi:hypothetical protein